MYEYLLRTYSYQKINKLYLLYAKGEDTLNKYKAYLEEKFDKNFIYIIPLLKHVKNID